MDGRAAETVSLGSEPSGDTGLQKRVRSILAAFALTAGAATLVGAAGGERTISLHNIHTKETVSVVYKRDGRFVEAGLAQVNHVMRDWRRNESTRMDPELVDILWEMHSELGSKEPIHIISGYRSRTTNDQLRRTVGGQASESRHILGKAADVHFPDVPIKKLRYSAMVREKGGVGYYPTSALPFVHVDTDRVRSWPRMPRQELALLFPSGVSQHAPADGGPLTKDDVRAAQARHPDLAMQIAEFHQQRRTPRGTLVADAGLKAPVLRGPMVPGGGGSDLPRLIELPRPVLAPAVATRTEPAGLHLPTAGDRAKLTELVSLANPSAPLLVSGPVPARRSIAALPSLTGTSGPAPQATAQPQASGSRVAAVDPGRNADRSLSDAASLATSTWIPAPAYDDEHPDEMSYRPFPIAPFLTETAEEPLLSTFVLIDPMRTLESIDQNGATLSVRLRPGEQSVALRTSQQFTGPAVNLDKLDAAKATKATSTASLLGRAVRTSRK